MAPDPRSAWLGIDWRAHQRWVRAGGHLLNVIDLGPEDPVGTVVWIHGLSGTWQNWLENLPAFATAYRCVALDLPGFGHSPMPEEPLPIDGFARVVDALLRELGVTRATIVGNSMGGLIGAEVAITYPTWVERLVLVSAAGLTIEHQRHDSVLRVLERAQGVLTMTAGWLGARSDALVRRPRTRRMLLGVVARHPERLSAPLAAEQLRGAGAPGFVPALDALTSYPIRDRLAKIRAPTLVVWGEEDRLVPVADAWDFGERITDSRVLVYTDTGHVPMLERPEAFNDAVLRFINEPPRFSRS